MDKRAHTFPFGEPVSQVVQLSDGSKKLAFVVGVYSSAVHARWIGPDGGVKVAALAVASEPHIFWRGEDAAANIPIIDQRLGSLKAAGSSNNGPSGRALDEVYLKPLGLGRGDVWLSDLVPNSLSNKGQQRAIQKCYDPIMQRFDLPKCTVQLEPESRTAWALLIDTGRLLRELKESQATTIVTLGNPVIENFLNRVCENKTPLLTPNGYGIQRRAVIDGKSYDLLCLAHMRVTTIRPLPNWEKAHNDWVNRVTS